MGSGNKIAFESPKSDNPQNPRFEFYVPYKQITSTPGYHWFAYYDKLETDPSGRYVLAMRTDFEDRTPTEKDSIEIGMVDTHDNCKWIHLGK